MTTSRRWDRAPETDADRRFFDLRESGYTGPIDQDGNAVTDPETLAIFDALAGATDRQMAARDAGTDEF
ncbi:hypothetical protein M1L60_19695 [Actinoplanes sp. TRM 88003]|uniref:Uncharacterized protein n=1 Tax=Paractinoplanes aksuensis TaxID=2939490 RepID=A0ABT1DPP3_9ACTN|nr:hypothetical protein [Actinoplanes aksuensis]MCO8272823.1 hypothetical protein [Actinoplanes aksuensis]